MRMRTHPSRAFRHQFMALSCILSILVGLAAGCLTQPNIGASISLDTRFTTPTNVIDLLRNFKLAMDEALFLRDDFYTDKVIKAFSGGREVTWDTVPAPGKNWGRVSDFAEMIKPYYYEGRPSPGLAMRFWGRLTNEEGIATRWSFVIAGPSSPTFSDTVSVFGQNWRKREGLIYAHPVIEDPPTKPYGNAHIDYKASSRGLERSMFFDFRPDATLQIANFWIRETPR